MMRGKVVKVDTKGVYVQTAEFGTLGPCQAVVANYAVGDMVLCDNVGDDGSPDLIVVGKLTPTGSVGGGLTLPVSSTDNAIVRWDGTTGTALQNSGVTVSDSDTVTAAGVTRSGTTWVYDQWYESGVRRFIQQTGTNTLNFFAADNTGDWATNGKTVYQIDRATGKFTLRQVGSTAGLEFGASGPRMMMGTGGPSGISAPVGSTWRQTDANASHGSLTGLLWNKVGTGTTEGTDWLVDYEGRWVDYTVTWAASGGSPSLGDGALEGRYTRRGKTAEFRVRLLWGSTTSAAATTDWTFTYPTTVAATRFAAACHIKQGGTYYVGVTFPSSSTAFKISLPANGNPVGVSYPAAWASGHYLNVTGTYEIA